VDTDLQLLVDSLARTLKCAVKLDDHPQLRLLAYNADFGDVDPVWIAAVVHRQVPGEVTSWLRTLNIAELETPVRIPANADLAMRTRVCVPVRYKGALLGHLWLVDRDDPLSEADLATAVAAADSAAILIYRDQLLGELERGQQREYFRDLLLDDPDIRQHAADRLARDRLLVHPAAVLVLVVVPVRVHERASVNAIQPAIGVALDRLRLTIPARHSLPLVRPDHGVLLLAGDDPAELETDAVRFAERLRDLLLIALDMPGDWRVFVGIGDPHATASDAVQSYRQAQQAVRVARLLPTSGPVVAWAKLGIYQTLASFPVDQLTMEMLHPGLVKLYASPDAGWLVQTLEAYLDRAGDAHATALDLTLHRSSLYHRLQRIEEVAGVSLRSGEDRLALHMGLKLARLAGIQELQGGHVAMRSPARRMRQIR
jgi:hypothetical protein